ncbi:MAG: DUF370 domain-containing protein [Saccharofermentans sp.]|nr:DUF370 domain-containing protein [Clostridiales bacterium]MCR5384988.1 DUF370 domain-containing protein [Saccharofermentans sp.]
MFIHIGNDLSILKSSVTAVVNLETVLPSQKDVADYLNSEDERGRLQYVTEDIPKSLVITDDKTYVCSLSAGLILNRLNQMEIF